MRFIDTHLHLIHLERFRYPWLDGAPALKRNFTLQDYLPQAQAAGITAALHMEVDVAEADIDAETAFVTGRDPFVIGAIAACRPESEAFAPLLERIAGNPSVKGLRRILHTSPDDLGRQPIFAENLRRLARHKLSFDLCVLPRQLPVAAHLADACPDVQFILDHCGVPDVKSAALDPWRRDIADVASRPNVACKISGVIAYGGPYTDSPEALRPFVEHVIACFGWNRVVWGSDWPVCTLTADLGKWVNATNLLIQGASSEEQERLRHRNAERLYRLG